MKGNNQSDDDIRNAEPSHAAIIGGGFMGNDIAVIFAAGGWNVHVMSPSQDTRDSLPARVRGGLLKLGASEKNATLVKVYGRIEDLPFPEISIVVESVSENLALKRGIFADLERLARPDAILASGTSTFPIGEIGKFLKTRSRVAGLHFFSPAHLVPLVEVTSAEATDRQVAERLIALMAGLGKKPIDVHKDVPGCVGNRLQHALLREAQWLVQNGVATPESIDTAVRYGFGFRYIACGPMMQKELSGWDTNYLSGTSIYPDLCNADAPPPFLKEMVEAGRTGMKSGRGLWEWDEETMAKEKARIERCLQAGMEILKTEGRTP